MQLSQKNFLHIYSNLRFKLKKSETNVLILNMVQIVLKNVGFHYKMQLVIIPYTMYILYTMFLWDRRMSLRIKSCVRLIYLLIQSTKH